ncbi:hypothetical protein EV363DRAFT_122785 [Boletus edulis]|nr:hypothetical protein EV363DRAFT_122785 [Boletus edulis]
MLWSCVPLVVVVATTVVYSVKIPIEIFVPYPRTLYSMAHGLGVTGSGYSASGQGTVTRIHAQVACETRTLRLVNYHVYGVRALHLYARPHDHITSGMERKRPTSMTRCVCNLGSSSSCSSVVPSPRSTAAPPTGDVIISWPCRNHWCPGMGHVQR